MGPGESVSEQDVYSLSLSDPSTTSHSTLRGLGSLTGSMMSTLGELMLKGIEAVTIQRRLSVIDSQLRYELRSTQAESDLVDERMCADLLELARRGIYTKCVKQKAWGLLLLLITEGRIRELIRVLLKWPEVEIQLFLTDMLCYMPPGWIVNPVNLTQRDPTRFASVDKDLRYLQALPLVYFLSQLLEASASTKAPIHDDASVISLSSFVSASGKMVLGPSAFNHGISVHLGYITVQNMVKSIVCGRLNTIATRFRLENVCSLPSPEVVRMHSEILQISRAYANDRCVQRQTQELLFISISRFHAVSLTHTLRTWTNSEIRLFIIRVLQWMQPFVAKNGKEEETVRSPKAYKSYLAIHHKSRHPVVPFLYFLAHLALASEAASEILLELDIVSTLKTMCINNFPNPSAYIDASIKTDGIALSDVYAVSSMLFVALSTHPSSCARLLRSRDLPRWFLSLYYSPDFLGLPDASQLQMMRVELEKPLIKFVLVAVEHVLKGEGAVVCHAADYLPLAQIYRDIVGVLGDHSSEAEVLYSASDTFLRCFALGGEFRRVLDIVLAESRSDDTLSILRTVVKSLGLLPDTESFAKSPETLRSTRRNMQRLARVYADDLKMYTSLVAELVGSQACNARYMLIDTSIHMPPSSDEHSTDAPVYVMQISSE